MYTVEQITKDYIILEDRNTLNIINVKKELFIGKVKEKDIVDYVNNKYVINTKLTKKTNKKISDKFKKLIE